MSPLRKRMLEELQLRNYSDFTIQRYLDAVKHFAEYFDQSPSQLEAEQIREYLLYLVKEARGACFRKSSLFPSWLASVCPRAHSDGATLRCLYGSNHWRCSPRRRTGRLFSHFGIVAASVLRLPQWRSGLQLQRRGRSCTAHMVRPLRQNARHGGNAGRGELAQHLSRRKNRGGIPQRRPNRNRRYLVARSLARFLVPADFSSQRHQYFPDVVTGWRVCRLLLGLGGPEQAVSEGGQRRW